MQSLVFPLNVFKIFIYFIFVEEGFRKIEFYFLLEGYLLSIWKSICTRFWFRPKKYKLLSLKSSFLLHFLSVIDLKKRLFDTPYYFHLPKPLE